MEEKEQVLSIKKWELLITPNCHPRLELPSSQKHTVVRSVSVWTASFRYWALVAVGANSVIVLYSNHIC